MMECLIAFYLKTQKMLVDSQKAQNEPECSAAESGLQFEFCCEAKAYTRLIKI